MSAALLAQLATCCRILAAEGHDHFFLGHVSARVPGAPDRLYIKRTGLGLGEVTPRDFLTIDLDGQLLAGDGALHHEVPIHTGVFRCRADVGCVIHTHPPCATAFSASSGRFELVSQDSIPFTRGVRHFDSPALVTSQAAGDALASALGDGNVVVMRNHGITVAGRDVEHATFLAVSLERSLAMQARAGGFGAVRPIPLPEAEQMAQYFDQHYAGRIASVWRALSAPISGAAGDPE